MRILVTVLDWGLGHASRTCEIISRLTAEGNEVIMAGSGRSLALMKGDFPQIKSVYLKSFSPSFLRRLPQWVAICLQVPKMIWRTWREQRDIERIVASEGVDLIISDNRYGARSRRCKSILITHQTTPIVTQWAPQWLNNLFARCLAVWINRFDEIWIPDIAPYPDGLSGELSSSRYIKRTIKTIGVLSRLSLATDISYDADTHFDNLAIISGPEPYRSVFEGEIVELMKKKGGKNIIIRGIPDKENRIGADHCTERHRIQILNHCNPQQMRALIMQSQTIYCHSGYSTIMDLWALNKRAYLRATPGQAEQEYLEKRMKQYGFNFF